mmetsp:Transcript_120989/g.353509  ORF Transcript_120989/g.353509 Transcript_120989/m.353509 type:complete len:194 (-) Transcript_120989:132-713(-)
MHVRVILYGLLGVLAAGERYASDLRLESQREVPARGGCLVKEFQIWALAEEIYFKFDRDMEELVRQGSVKIGGKAADNLLQVRRFLGGTAWGPGNVFNYVLQKRTLRTLLNTALGQNVVCLEFILDFATPPPSVTIWAYLGDFPSGTKMKAKFVFKELKDDSAIWHIEVKRTSKRNLTSALEKEWTDCKEQEG